VLIIDKNRLLELDECNKMVSNIMDGFETESRKIHCQTFTWNSVSDCVTDQMY
jgi:NifU-like protein involved in Fe-S cluster formation